ncbi:helix-turn-helix transcriptional regulator [Tengunoibacter tsumagoiensis]|uniref:Transcriptional regulator n=1 Tax=Tengunoibacter tsumagoiensis TaxID=2014871 RepID=A0A402A609_9CHLR|nr:helix-turn-helix transcriptional regulator [Tengunoibacter tsumagoiensis]GCE14587.1 transcriptional regulator [Tengunoibacter tsumagoiensis]
MNDEQRRSELAHFLRSRRERLKPSQFSLPEGAKQRRTPGLRREELAQVAGISPIWYTKLEQGRPIQVSAQVLESLVRTLQLNDQEREYLYVLAREHLPLPAQHHTSSLNAQQQGMLDALNPHPAMILNERWDIVGWNQSAAQVFTDYHTLPAWERNVLWMMFTRPEQRTLYAHWEELGKQILANFRASSGSSTGDPWWILRRDRLMQVSPEFRQWWSQHDIGTMNVERKELNHPRAGLLVLQPTTLVLADDPNLKLFLYTPLAQADTARKLAWLANAGSHLLARSSG